MSNRDYSIENIIDAAYLKEAGIFVVGVSGKLASGKTTLCNNIINQCEMMQCRVRFYNFADALKKQISAHTGVPIGYFYTEEGKRNPVPGYGGMTVGEMLQAWGTALRTVHQDVWINALAVQLRACVAEFQSSGGREKSLPFGGQSIILIGDVRLPNEYRFIKEKCGGIIIRVEGDPSGERIKSTRDLNHISECALDEEIFDEVIDTNSLDKRSACHLAIQAIGTKMNAQLDPFERWYADESVEYAIQQVLRERILPLFGVICDYRSENDGKPFDPRTDAQALWDYAFHTPYLCSEKNIASLAAPFFDVQCWSALENMTLWLAQEADEVEWRQYSRCLPIVYWSLCEWKNRHCLEK